MKVEISKSSRADKKYQATAITSGGSKTINKTVHFGAQGYTDFTEGAGDSPKGQGRSAGSVTSNGTKKMRTGRKPTS